MDMRIIDKFLIRDSLTVNWIREHIKITSSVPKKGGLDLKSCLKAS